MKKIITLAFVFILSQQALAQNEKGNGGDALVCKDGQNTKAMVLDYYETTAIRGIKVDLGSDSLHYLDKAKYALQKMAKIFPVFASSLQQEVDTFPENTSFVAGIVLEDIDDSQEIYIPKNCEKLQLAIRANKKFPTDREYLVSKDIWDMLDENNKAVLVLHEIIYRRAFLKGAMDSRWVRYVNSNLLSEKEVLVSSWLNIMDTAEGLEKNLFASMPMMMEYPEYLAPTIGAFEKINTGSFLLPSPIGIRYFKKGVYDISSSKVSTTNVLLAEGANIVNPINKSYYFQNKITASFYEFNQSLVISAKSLVMKGLQLFGSAVTVTTKSTLALMSDGKILGKVADGENFFHLYVEFSKPVFLQINGSSFEIKHPFFVSAQNNRDITQIDNSGVNIYSGLDRNDGILLKFGNEFLLVGREIADVEVDAESGRVLSMLANSVLNFKDSTGLVKEVARGEYFSLDANGILLRKFRVKP